ncbi:MAG TPA: SgcJ/EcaC family oxidoreductase [Aliidongia sp.]|uniref:YybH family protein n=1 Tax=Aliidongia sp. TaxID=1914230 RepID=UPI002DDD64A6|nr:SgcJ/EcaC family oxidoreductase [Aliidongia sp.]HEV2678573.1 SgcJ/EcaC family oxidoreductase [Aliidongia sp.]
MARDGAGKAGLLKLACVASGLVWATAAGAAQTEPERMIEEARPAIEAANHEWLPAIKQQDAKTLVAPYAENGIFLTKTGESVVGRAAIEKLYQDGFAKSRVVDADLVQDGLTAQGALIYEWGHARIEAEHDGTRSTRTGAYLTVWQRSPDGVWRIIRNLTF